jgi:hypothetical protein
MSLREPSNDPSNQSSPETSTPKRPVSERSIQANRRNALRSTGPKTARGKRTVARNAIRHGLLTREVVISAGDGAENLEEFNNLVEKLCEYYEPVGIAEELLVQKIATCWWRKARVIRAENGEICKRLDSTKVDHYLSGPYHQCRPCPGSFDQATPEPPGSGLWKDADTRRDNKRSATDRLVDLLACQQYYRATRKTWEELRKLQAQRESKPASEELNETINREFEKLYLIKEYLKEWNKLESDAEARSLSLPPADATDKLLRYEAHLDRQLYRAMDQLERLQRKRGGETVPPPLNINLGRRN